MAELESLQAMLSHSEPKMSQKLAKRKPNARAKVNEKRAVSGGESESNQN